MRAAETIVGARYDSPARPAGRCGRVQAARRSRRYWRALPAGSTSVSGPFTEAALHGSSTPEGGTRETAHRETAHREADPGKRHCGKRDPGERDPMSGIPGSASREAAPRNGTPERHPGSRTPGGRIVEPKRPAAPAVGHPAQSVVSDGEHHGWFVPPLPSHRSIRDAVAVIGAGKVGSLAIPPDVAARCGPRSATNTDISREKCAQVTVLPVFRVPDACYVSVCRRKPARSNLAQTDHGLGRTWQRARAPYGRSPAPSRMRPARARPASPFAPALPAMCMYVQSAAPLAFDCSRQCPRGTLTSMSQVPVLHLRRCPEAQRRAERGQQLLGNLLSGVAAQPIERGFQQRRRPWSARP